MQLQIEERKLPKSLYIYIRLLNLSDKPHSVTNKNGKVINVLEFVKDPRDKIFVIFFRKFKIMRPGT